MTEAARPTSAFTVPDGRIVRVDDTREPDRPVVVWHHETPHTGPLYEPLLSAAADAGVRLVTVTRPGFGGADPRPGRDVATAAADVVRVLDALDVRRYATIGGSGGGPHALALAALDPERVAAVAVFASPAPFVDTPTWWDGMADDGGLRSAHIGGREARLTHADNVAFDPAVFTDADWAALAGPWAGLGDDAERAGATAREGEADDDLAFVRPWGVDLAAVRCPVRVVQGDDDRIVPAAHGRMLVEALPDATLDLRPGDGHLSILEGVPGAIRWLASRLWA